MHRSPRGSGHNEGGLLECQEFHMRSRKACSKMNENKANRIMRKPLTPVGKSKLKKEVY